MNTTAYLVIWLDCRAGSLQIVACAIYSEPQPTSVDGTIPFSIMECEASDFSEAKDEVEYLLRTYAEHTKVYKKLLELFEAQ